MIYQHIINLFINFLKMDKLNKELKDFIQSKIKDLKANKDNTFKVVATTEDVDRDGEIIRINGWQMENFLKNPVILANHNYTIQSIVWKMTHLYNDGEKVIVEGIFTEDTDAGKIAKNLYNTWFLKTVSVGFRPLKRNEENYKVIESAELLEVSFVPVPANQNALSLEEKTKAFDLGLMEKSEDQGEENQEPDPTPENEPAEDNAQSEDIKEIKQELKEIKELLIQNQKFFDTLKDANAFMSQKSGDDNLWEDTVKENYKSFLQNLNKNISKSLCDLKK